MQAVGPAKAPAQVTYKTGALQQSEHYVWNTSDILGRGATAVVYFGRHQEHGDVCAVKVFHDRESRQMFVTKQREIEILSSMKHRNIVQLLALERETVSSNEVLVMEYCSGGSLFTMLESPEFALGFPEDEFMMFLGDISSGMHYLRQKGFVHRDIKPGNIMRVIGEDGRSIYKITDFGASRELQDDETFMSLYGTEEYLFPGMYQKAVLRQAHAGNQSFTVSVDIWSLGVTIYHVCTGQLPFQPYGGRNNTTTMHKITSQKPSGIISGVQEVMHGPIKWRKDLPTTCLLPSQLKKMLTGMLSGLLENDHTRMWTFDRYFEEITVVLSLVTIQVFDTGTGENLLIYIRRTDRFAAVVQTVAKVADVSFDQMLIFWQDKLLKEVVKEDQEVQHYPRKIMKEQLYLVRKSLRENLPLTLYEIPSFPRISLDERMDVVKDAQIAKRACSTAYRAVHVTSLVISQQTRLVEAEAHFRTFVESVVSNFVRSVPEMRNLLEETQARLKATHVACRSMMEVYDVIIQLINTGVLTFNDPQARDKVTSNFQELRKLVSNEVLIDFSNKIEGRLHEVEVYVGVLSEKVTEQDHNGLLQGLTCQDQDYCSSKAENLKTKISAISTTMSKHRRYQDLHSHEQFIHKCEIQKLEENSVSLLSITQDHCVRNLIRCHPAVIKEIGLLLKHLSRTEKVEQNVSNIKECLKQLSKRLSDMEASTHSLTQNMTLLLKEQLRKKEGSTSVTAPIKLPSEVMEKSGVQEVSRVATREMRRELVGRLSDNLGALQSESEGVRQLFNENNDLLKRMLLETSNLDLSGSLNSDHRERPTAPD